MISSTLPSGKSCELLLGQFDYNPDPNRPSDVAADPAASDAALVYVLSRRTCSPTLTSTKPSNENRSEENFARDTDGKDLPYGAGTDNYDADVEYDLAVDEAVSEAIGAHVESRGIPSTGLGFQSQKRCTEPTP